MIFQNSEVPENGFELRLPGTPAFQNIQGTKIYKSGTYKKTDIQKVKHISTKRVENKR